jgi:ribonuclease III
MPFEALYNKLGYQFKNIDLLQLALRHCSLGKSSNERLEFLGDALLNFIIGAELFQRYPQLNEGELSRLRSNLVNGEILALLARELDINKYLQVGIGELKCRGGTCRDSMLADTVEAIIGAIYLDSDVAACKNTVLHWFEQHLNTTALTIKKDSKTMLQETLQAKKLALPTYKVLSITGTSHNQIFSVECKVSGLAIITTGVGSSKRKAEQEAAAQFLAHLIEHYDK